MRFPTVSVIVPAYNEEATLGRCLDSLLRQTVPTKRYEIIVVDDGSTDRTAEIARTYGNRVVVLAGKHAGPGAARNQGVRASSGDVLVFVDADMALDRSYIEMLVRPMLEDRAVTGTFTIDEYVGNVDRGFARYWSRLANLPDDRRMPADHPATSEVFRAIWRSAFERVDGYDEVGTGEDKTLSRKLGTFAIVAPGALCYHDNPETARDVYVTARWYGRTDQEHRSARDLLRVCPPVALARFVRRMLRQDAGQAVFTLLHDLGSFVGMCERLLGRAGHAK